MARYYVMCEATPSMRLGRNTTSYNRVYPQAPHGFLFHDTEHALTKENLKYPLFVLSDTHGHAKTAFAVRVNPNTIFACFSMRGLPYPTRVRFSYENEGEYLQARQLQGYLYRDVKNPRAPIDPIDWHGLYDQCERLERFTDACPCPSAGKPCKSENLPKALSLPAETLDNDFSVPEAALLRKKRFRNIGGFEFVTGAYTTQHEFMESLRPWDYHDFSAVADRVQIYTDRGLQRTRKLEKRKQDCAVCAFNYEDKGCGRELTCTRPMPVEEARARIKHWCNVGGLDAPMSSSLSFSKTEINYLLSVAGSEVRTRAITSTRRTQAVLGGFKKEGGCWYYVVSADARPYTRKVRYRTYTDLAAAVTSLPGVAPATEVTEAQRLAASIIGVSTCLPIGSYEWHATRLVSEGAALTVAKPSYRHRQVIRLCESESTIRTYYRYLFNDYDTDV